VNFALTEEQQFLQKATRDFAKNEVLPKAAAIDAEHRHPKELVAKMSEMGLMGVAVPEELGGSGMDNVSYALAIEEIARACASTAVIMSVNNSLVCDPIMKYGSEEQKKEWLPKLAEGKKLGCFAISEPEAGSDAAAQTTTARLDEATDEWVLQGTKNWITNGPVADVCVLMAMTDREQGHRGITAFILPMDAEGVSTSPPDDKLGIRGSKSCQIFLDNVRLPKTALLGEVGQGFKVAMTTLDGGRIGIAAQALGIARACLEDGLEYALQRRTFGKPIAEHQSIQWKLADMATEVDAARLLILSAARKKDQGKPFGQAAAMAKLFASDAANKAGRECIQIFGGNGYVTEYPAERHFRDAKITEIYEGTSEIQRLVITNYMRKGE
jgi:butyryl-CoA dehydrogenase